MKKKEKYALRFLLIFLFTYFGGLIIAGIQTKYYNNFTEGTLIIGYFISFLIGYKFGKLNKK